MTTFPVIDIGYKKEESIDLKKLLELSESVGEFTRIIQSEYLEPWQCYIIDKYQDPVFPIIRYPRTLMVHKEMYDMVIRYIKWRDAWLEGYLK